MALYYLDVKCFRYPNEPVVSADTGVLHSGNNTVFSIEDRNNNCIIFVSRTAVNIEVKSKTGNTALHEIKNCEGNTVLHEIARHAALKPREASSLLNVVYVLINLCKLWI